MTELSSEPSMSLEPSSSSTEPRPREREGERLLAPDTFAELLAAVLEEHLGADVAWILHAEEDGQVSFLSSGAHDERRVRLWIPPNTPVVSAFERGSPMVFDDYACARFRECTASGWNGFEARSLLLVPVPAAPGRRRWAIELASARADAFSSIDPSSLQDLLVEVVGPDVYLTRPISMVHASRAIATLSTSLSRTAEAPSSQSGEPADLGVELSHDVNNGLAVLAGNIGNLVQTVEEMFGAVTRAKTLLYMAQLGEEADAVDEELRRGVELALEALDGCEARELAADALEIASEARAAVARITSAVERVVHRDDDNPNQMPQAVRLDDEVARLAQLVSRALPRNSCALSVHAPQAALPAIMRPRQLVQAALLNMLHSAVASASRAGSPRPGSIVVRSFAEGGAVCVAVLDNGLLEHDDEEDEDELSLVAPPRLAAGPSRSGLEEAREAVEALGGSLSVESVPGTGTLVTMSVPCSRTQGGIS